ncbi:MAG: hypothetical protein ACE5G2_01690 [Candidatus Krumholzibacteriia bacterium]
MSRWMMVALARSLCSRVPLRHNTSESSWIRTRVEGFDLVPPDPDCPFLLACDEPFFSKVCVGGGEVVLNGPGPRSCQVAVEQHTWTSIKSLYQ